MTGGDGGSLVVRPSSRVVDERAGRLWRYRLVVAASLDPGVGLTHIG